MMKTRQKKRSPESEDEDWRAKGENSKSEDDDSEEKPKRIRSKRPKKPKVKEPPPASNLKPDSSSLMEFVEKNRLPNLPRGPFTERLFSSRNELFSLKSRSSVKQFYSASEVLKSRGILSESSILIANPVAERIKSEKVEEVTLDNDDHDDRYTDTPFVSAGDTLKDPENDEKSDLELNTGQCLENTSINDGKGNLHISVSGSDQNETDAQNNVRHVYRNVYENVLNRLQFRLKNNSSDSKACENKREEENIVQEACVMLDDIFRGMQMETLEHSDETSDEESNDDKIPEKSRHGKSIGKENDSIWDHENLTTLKENNKKLQETVSSKRKTIVELIEKLEMLTSREEKINKNLLKVNNKNKELEKALETALNDIEIVKKQLDEVETKSCFDIKKITELEIETAKAAEQIFDFNGKNNKLLEENKKLSLEIEKLKTSKEEENQRLSHEIEKLRTSKACTLVQHSSIESHYRKIKQCYLSCNENLSDTDKEDSNLTTAIINVFERFNNTVKDTKIKQEIRDDISKQYESAYRKLAENKDNEIDALNAEINVLKSNKVSTDVNGLQEKVLLMEKEKEKYQTKAKVKIEIMKKEFFGLQQDVKSAVDNNVRRDEQIAKLTQRLKDSENETDMYKSKLNESQDKLKSINNSVASYVNLKNEFALKNKELEDRNFRADQTIQRLNSQLSCLQTDSNEIMRKESEQFRERERMLEEELKKYEREKVELQKEASDTKKKASEFTVKMKEYEQFREKVRTLQEELKRSEKERLEFQKEAADTKKKASEFSVKMKENFARINALSMEVQNDKLEELEKTLSKVRQENEQLKNENKKFKVRINASQKEENKLKKFDLPLE